MSSLGTIQVLNTRFSDATSKMKGTENTIEQIKAKLRLIHNEIISPKDFIFSIDWLDKLVACR
jgi:ribosome-interacting GTPase 1